MSQVAIVGGNDSGRTTFLGLLYHTSLIYGTEHTDDFRFHAPPGSLRAIDEIYRRMRAGHFPDAERSYARLDFLLGFRSGLSGRLERKVKWIRDREIFSPFDVLWLTLYDISLNDLVRNLDQQVGLDATTVEILKGSALIIVVDCSKINIPKVSKPHKSPLAYDRDIARFLELFATRRARSKKARGSKAKSYQSRIPFAFVFSKFDSVSDEIFERLHLSQDVPPPDRRKKRSQYFEKLLRDCFPMTFSVIRSGKSFASTFRRPAYFHSWIDTEAESDGSLRIKQAWGESEGGAVLSYSQGECVALINHLRNVSRKIS